MKKPHHHRFITGDRKPLITLILLFIPLLTLTFLLILSTKPSHPQSPPARALAAPPRFAYLISGSADDGDRIKRLLHAVYHPLNLYLIHLDLGCGPEERADLRGFIESDQVFARFGNVRVLEKADVVSDRGPTVVAMVLHAVAVLFKERKEWSWFINLSASDYPIMSQDGEFPFFVGFFSFLFNALF